MAVTLGENERIGSYEDDVWLLEVKVCVGSVACAKCELDVYGGMRNMQTSTAIRRSSRDMSRQILPLRTLKHRAIQAANELLTCDRELS